MKVLRLVILGVLMSVFANMNAQENKPVNAGNPTTGNPAASDNECTIIFYHKSKALPVILKTLVVTINCKNSGKEICSLWDGTYYKYVTSELGAKEITASVKKESKPIKLKLEAGKTYYVSCCAKDDVFFKYGAEIEIVGEVQALKEISTFKEVKP